MTCMYRLKAILHQRISQKNSLRKRIEIQRQEKIRKWLFLANFENGLLFEADHLWL